MSNREIADLLTITLHQQAESAHVTPAGAAERAFWDRRSPRPVTVRRRRLALTAAVLAVVLLLGGLFLSRGDRASAPSPPAVPTQTVTPTVVEPSVADATAHLIGNGAVVADRLWFVMDDRLVITTDAGRRVGAHDLPAGSDGELLCCVQDVGGDAAVVPTSTGYSFRDAVTGSEMATAGSVAPGPAAVVGEDVWVRSDIDTSSPTTAAGPGATDPAVAISLPVTASRNE